MTIGIDRPFTPKRRRCCRRRHRRRRPTLPPASDHPQRTAHWQRQRPARVTAPHRLPGTCRVRHRSHRIATTTIGGHRSSSSRSVTATATGVIDAAIASAVTCTPNSRPWPASKSCEPNQPKEKKTQNGNSVLHFPSVSVSFVSPPSIYRHGLDIRGCLLRMICEAKHYLLPHGKSFFHDVLRILF